MPGGPELRYCGGGCPGPAGASPASVGEAGSPHSARLPDEGPHGPRSHLHPRPRWVGSRRPDSHKLPPARPTAVIVSPRASYLHGAGDSGSCSRPPGSVAPGPRLRRARRLRARVRQGRSARLLIPAGGGGGGASARSGLAAAGRGPSHQRWRGAEGRAEQAGWVGSVLRVAMASSTPGQTPLGQGRAVQSGRWPRPRPAPQPSAPAALRPRGTRRLRGRRAGSEGGRAPPRTWAGPSAGEAGQPCSPSGGDGGRATAPSSVQPATCAPARPAPPRSALGAGAPRGGPPGAPLPDADRHTSDLCLTWSCGRSPALRAAPRNRALRHQGHASPAAVVENALRRERERGAQGQNQERLEGDR